LRRLFNDLRHYIVTRICNPPSFLSVFLHENDGQKHIATRRTTSVSQSRREPIWLESSSGYYALLKRGGKQFRRAENQRLKVG
jgi:hypothetical protein